MTNCRKKIIMIISIFLSIIVLGIIYVFGIDLYIKLTTKSKIISVKEASNLKDVDCVIILGAGVWGDKPSHMLEDRLLQGIELYNKGVVPKILMSGDHGRVEYDEVNLMKQFAIDKGINSKDVFMDHAGFSTYETMYRARDIFQANKVIIVTQKYHLYRALHIADKLGIEAYGVGSDQRKYYGSTYREIREILARNKDFIKCIIQPKPTYLGDAIPISGDGNKTNDKDNVEDKNKDSKEDKDNE